MEGLGLLAGDRVEGVEAGALDDAADRVVGRDLAGFLQRRDVEARTRGGRLAAPGRGLAGPGGLRTGVVAVATGVVAGVVAVLVTGAAGAGLALGSGDFGG